MNAPLTPIRTAGGTALRNRAFRRLWASQVASVVGDQVFPVAVTVSVLRSGGGVSTVGLVLAARWVALVAFVLAGGVWADRLPRRRVMMAAHAFRAAAVTTLVFLPGTPPVLVLVGLVFVVGGAEAFFRPAYSALLASLLTEDQRASGNALTSVSVRTGAIVGPGMGAAIVAVASPRPAFVLTVLAFATSLAVLVRLREPSFTPEPRRAALREVWEGFGEVRSRPWLAAVLAVASIQIMMALAPAQVLLPVISQRDFGSESLYGIALSAFSAGGLLGALVAMRWRPRQQGLTAMLALLPYTLVPIALLYGTRWTILAAYLVAGLGIEIFMIYWQVALQREIPPDRLARVTALDYLASFALMPLGLALTGAAVDLAGEGAILWTAAFVMSVPTLLLLLVPGMKTFGTPTADEPLPGAPSNGRPTPRSMEPLD